ncbi:unnamed protein product [Protopolystoma xenopodis]|uniref:Uncharacterized protein n=1 Tax=Protopolystoma xenopodis TaxID=117903 RepID=A0A3S5CID2_9PLAT|nr:unnamed protein product [Protopolystoma xenopodis]
MEVEEGERLPFLDVEMIRSNGTLKKKLFRKKKNIPFPVPSQVQAKDWNNEEHDDPKPTPDGCTILGRGAGQIDEDIARQWLPNRMGPGAVKWIDNLAAMLTTRVRVPLKGFMR